MSVIYYNPKMKVPMPPHRDFLVWLIVIAEEPAVKPHANVIGYHNYYNRLYECKSYYNPLLSVANLPEWSGDNIVIVAQCSTTLQ